MSAHAQTIGHREKTFVKIKDLQEWLLSQEVLARKDYDDRVADTLEMVRNAIEKIKNY